MRGIEPFTFEDPVESISQSSVLKSFFEHALAESLCRDKPVALRRKGKTRYAVVDHRDIGNSTLQPLKEAVGRNGIAGNVSGPVPNLSGVFWAEALSIKVEERNGLLWLLIRPDIWITPLSLRENATDFLRSKKLYRYNTQSCQLLDAWIKVLCGSVGEGEEVSFSCYPSTDFGAIFKLHTRTAYSRSGGSNG